MRVPRLLACALVVLGLGVSGCATTIILAPTQRTPSTNASLKLKHDGNGNIRMSLDVQHLPPPGRLGEGLNTYVVWVLTPDRRAALNVGQLKVSDDQNGSLDTLTPLTSFYLMVTAETAGDTLVPGQVVVLEGNGALNR